MQPSSAQSTYVGLTTSHTADAAERRIKSLEIQLAGVTARQQSFQAGQEIIGREQQSIQVRLQEMMEHDWLVLRWNLVLWALLGKVVSALRGQEASV